MTSIAAMDMLNKLESENKFNLAPRLDQNTRTPRAQTYFKPEKGVDARFSPRIHPHTFFAQTE